MYGMGGGAQMGPFLRRRAITHTILGAVFLAIGIIITVASYSAANSASGGIYFVPFGLIIIGALWFFGGLSMLARTSRFR